MTNPELDRLQSAPVETITLALSVNEVNVVLASLQEMPFKHSDPVIRKIMEQANSQVSK